MRDGQGGKDKNNKISAKKKQKKKSSSYSIERWPRGKGKIDNS
jgi:hypothetical protein